MNRPESTDGQAGASNGEHGRIHESSASESVVSTLGRDLSARAHDSEQGYRRAAQDASDSDLKQQFEQLANERSAMAAES